MKTLGLIGGTSWESTSLYYTALNRLARDRLGGLHSAPLLLRSVDFAPLSDLMARDDWASVAARMVGWARDLEAAGARAVLICSNTLHRTAPQVRAAVGVPLIDVADAAARSVRAAGGRKALLLGTRFTMEAAFYRDALARSGLVAVAPPPAAREALHRIIFEELTLGKVLAGSRLAVLDMARTARREQGVDSVILGCTELAMLAAPGDYELPAVDTVEAHAAAAMDFAMAA
jgi:aspartate racemase